MTDDSVYVKSSLENDEQYIWRIGSLKAASVITDNWDYIAQKMNAQLYSSEDDYKGDCVYRKTFAVAQQYYNNVFSKMLDGERYRQLREERDCLNVERSKLRSDKNEFSAYISRQARREKLLETIETAVAKLEPLVAPKPVENTSKSELTHMVCFGDEHYGADFTVTGCNGEVINRYNPDVFERRMWELAAAVKDYVRVNRLGSIYVCSLGDCIDGILRVGQLRKLKYGIIESAMRYADFMANWLNDISYDVEVRYISVNGNHSELRILGEDKGTFSEENIGFVIQNFIKLRLVNNHKVKFLYSNGDYAEFKDNGIRIGLAHNGKPELQNTYDIWSKKYNSIPNIMIVGHLHHLHSEEIGIGKTVVTLPSIVGTDPYAMSISRTSDAGAVIMSADGDAGIKQLNLIRF